jgi:hypothetical protein
MLRTTAGMSFMIGKFDVDTRETSTRRRDGVESPLYGEMTSFIILRVHSGVIAPRIGELGGLG